MSENKKDILSYAGAIWSTADILRGVGIKESDFPEYMMPMFALLMTESRILRKLSELEEQFGSKELAIEEYIEEVNENIRFNQPIYGMNELLVKDGITLRKVCENDLGFNKTLGEYLDSYDNETKDLLGILQRDGDNKLDIYKHLKKLDDKGVKFQYVKAWSEIDLTDFNNSDITTLEEDIKRRWADISAATSGEQYTPSDIIALISEICVSYYREYNKTAQNINIYDMTCGGGNMLFGIEDNIDNMLIKNQTPVEQMPYMRTYGQEYNSSLYALAKIESRFRKSSNIAYGNTLTNDQFPETKMNIIGANPPYGIDWKQEEKAIRNDKTGRFHYYPSVSDGQLLFLQHGISKLTDDPTQLSIGCIVLNGSPLFSGDAGSGESEIRKWILDNDYLEALIQLPTSEFFNTNITTYIWVLNKNKKPNNKNKIKLIDSSEMFTKLKKSKGSKSKELAEEARGKIVEWLLNDNIDNENVKVFDRSYFYYNKQRLIITHEDVNGKAFVPMKNDREVKSIKIENVKEVRLKETGERFLLDELNEISDEDLKGKAKELTEKFNVDEGELIVVLDDDTVYQYNTEKETIEAKDVSGKITNLGCGQITFKASYKKATKIKPEHIQCFVELSSKKETDYEVIPFSFDEEENNKNIEEFLNQWVEKKYELKDRIIGVEVNFNKIFYKPEVLRPLEEIQQDLLNSHDKLSKLMQEVFND